MLESIKHFLWHGNVCEALDRMFTLSINLDQLAPSSPAARKLRADCPWVFPAPKSAQGFMANPGWATVTAIREKSGISDFRLHDVRRTVATRLAEAGTPVYVIEAVLGHRPPKLVRTYQKHGYVPEARAALEAWGARLARMLTGKEGAADVLSIRARGL